MIARARLGSPCASPRPSRRVRRAPRPRRTRDVSRAVRHRVALSASGLRAAATPYDPAREGWRLRWARARFRTSPTPPSSSDEPPPANDKCAPRSGLPMGAPGCLDWGPRVLAQAESLAAPAFFEDIAGSAAVVLSSVFSREWGCPLLRRQAAVFARSLDLLPRDHAPAVWSSMVCSLAACIVADICPAFKRARVRAAECGFFFSLVPLRGRCGWRRRARAAGLL